MIHRLPAGRTDKWAEPAEGCGRKGAASNEARAGRMRSRRADLVLGSERALWGFDFPFGLPVELFPEGVGWREQFDFLRGWGDDAYGCGLECVRRATEFKTGSWPGRSGCWWSVAPARS